MDAENHSVVEDGCDLVLGFADERPRFEHLIQHSRYATSSESLTDDEANLYGEGERRKRAVAAKKSSHEDPQLGGLLEGGRRSSSTSSTSAPEGGTVSDNSSTTRPDTDKLVPTPVVVPSDESVPSVLDRITSELLVRTSSGRKFSTQLRLQADVGLHVDEWDREEAVSHDAIEVIMNASNTALEVRSRRMMFKRKSDEGEPYVPRFKIGSGEVGATGGHETALDKYRGKLAEKAGHLAGLLGIRAKKRASAQLSSAFSLEGRGAAPGASWNRSAECEDEEVPWRTGENNSIDENGAVDRTAAASRITPFTYEEAAVLARACTIYHFQAKPNATEAAAFRKQFWARFKQAYPEFFETESFTDQWNNRGERLGSVAQEGAVERRGDSWVFRSEDTAQTLRQLDTALMQLRYEFELVRPRF